MSRTSLINASQNTDHANRLTHQTSLFIGSSGTFQLYPPLIPIGVACRGGSSGAAAELLMMTKIDDVRVISLIISGPGGVYHRYSGPVLLGLVVPVFGLQDRDAAKGLALARESAAADMRKR
jgi:hypothetical protein